MMTKTYIIFNSNGKSLCFLHDREQAYKLARSLGGYAMMVNC